jgi:hypothetical protein
VTRRRYVQIDGVLHEVGDDYVGDARDAKQRIVNDRHYDGQRATDGTDISTRAKHRAYMKVNDLTTMDDFKGVWQKAAKERDQIRTGSDTQRRANVERALHDVVNRRRR